MNAMLVLLMFVGIAPTAAAGQTAPPAQTVPAAQRGAPARTPPAPGSIKPQPVGTMRDLMARVIYPASDAISYIATRVPKNEGRGTSWKGRR